VSAFITLLVKELKSIIRDPKMLIAMFVVPLVMIGVMYGIMFAAITQQAEQAIRESGVIAIIDLDHGVWSQRFIDYLRDQGITFKLVENNAEHIPDIMSSLGVRILYVIPSNFSEALAANKTAVIEYYVWFKALTVFEMGIADRASELIGGFSENITRSIIAKSGVPEEFVRYPVNSTSLVVLGTKIVKEPEQVLAGVLTTSLIIPLMVFIMLVFIIQFAVTSIAVEKEEKMFETLLTLPINRLTIVGVKLLVSVIIGIAYVVIYGAILLWFLAGSLSAPAGAVGGEGINLSIVLPPNTVYYIGAGMIGAVLFGLLLAMILSLFAEDVRTAQLVSNYALTPLIIMFFLSMFIDLSSLSYTVRAVLSLIPLANISFIPKLMILGNQELGLIASVSNIAYAGAATVIAYRIVNTERIFTARLFKKRIKVKKR